MITNVTFANAVRMQDNSVQTFITSDHYQIIEVSDSKIEIFKKGSDKVKVVYATNIQDMTKLKEEKKSKKSE